MIIGWGEHVNDVVSEKTRTHRRSTLRYKEICLVLLGLYEHQ